MDEFKLTETFGIDDGELDRLPNQLCFVLGVEWQMIHQKVETGVSFDTPFHSENQCRIAALCERRGVSYTIVPHDDWPTLVVN